MKNIRIGNMKGSTLDFISPSRGEYGEMDEESLAFYMVARTSEYFRTLKSDVKTRTHGIMDLTLRFPDPMPERS